VIDSGLKHARSLKICQETDGRPTLANVLKLCEQLTWMWTLSLVRGS